MQSVRPSSFICARCLRTRALRNGLGTPARYASSDSREPENRSRVSAQPVVNRQEKGAMSRLLEQMSEESLETGGRSAQKAVEEAGFGEDVRKRLQEKIAAAAFRSDNASAFAQSGVPAAAGRAARDTAAARPWTGTEGVEVAAFRMLNDAHKPLRPSSAKPGFGRAPVKVDTGRPSTKISASDGGRIANARDKTSAYTSMRDPNLSPEEREKFRQEMKQRFQPSARATPATLQGLASLANQRIDDAIARGQFKNLPRGKQIERDYNASNPFLDTTEYFMNKIIQKQDIVPPWIEKQQELVSTAARFRGRLRVDWKRHVSRTIASKGGGLEKQMELADEYAYAESLESPTIKMIESMHAVDERGHLSQITLAGDLKPAVTRGDKVAESEIEIVEQSVNDDGTLKAADMGVTITIEQPAQVSHLQSAPALHTQQHRRPTVPPYRDPRWEEVERSYHQAAIDNLNSMTRSYNLMAPDLAKKPYFSLARELKSCFADVAPLVAGAIRERALAPKSKGMEIVGHRRGGVMDRFALDKAAHVYDDRKPQYGFREFWRDLFWSKS